MQNHSKLIKLFLIFFSFFISLTLLRVYTYADAACGAGYYCLGTVMDAAESGCNFGPGGCTQRYSAPLPVSCWVPGNCSGWGYVNYCNTTLCTTYPGISTYYCCAPDGGGGGGGDDPDDPPAATEITDCISPKGTITGLSQTLRWDATTNATKYQYKIGSGGSIKDNGLNLTKAVTLPANTGTWYARGVIGSATTPWSGCSWSYTPPCTPVNGVLSAFSSCPVCDYGTQTATCTEGSCGGTTCSSLCSTAGGTYNSTTKVCTRNCSTSCPPKGYHDGAECIDDEGPNLRKIRVWGWACDKSDYSKPLTIHSYLDGVYGAGGTFINPAGSASNSGEVGIANACGGFPNHRFNYISTSSYPSGTHSVYSFAINIGAYPDANPLLTTSPKTVNCCTPNNPSLVWGSCSGGTQLATCNPPPYCGGSCSAECIADGGTYDAASNTCSRSCLYVEGNIWSDDNGDGVKDNLEKWKDPTYLSGCSTSKTHPSFILNYSGEFGNQIKGWWCHTTLGAYYKGSTGVVANIEPEQPHTFTLSNWPDGYKPKAWDYQNESNYSEASGIWTSGNFTTASLSMPSSGWTNVHWELQQEKYNLIISIKEFFPEEVIDFPGDCNTPPSTTSVDGATVIVRDSANAVTLCEKISAAGKVSCPIWIKQGEVKITVTIPSADPIAPDSYSIKCPNSTSPYPFTPPAEPIDNASVPLEIIMQKEYKNGWVSAVDSDIFANMLSVVVPNGPTDNEEPSQTPQGFAKTLINSSSNNNTSLGFAFSETGGTDNSPNSPSKIFESMIASDSVLGGNAYNLLVSSQQHDSKWLENFTFGAPLNATEIETADFNNLESDEVYKISVDTLPNSYTVSDGGLAVLYIDNDLTINNNFTTASSGRLLLVVDGSVTIDSDVGEDTATFNMSKDPHIEAGIIASAGISFESIGGSITQTIHDDPIMVSAPLISRTGLTFDRDLYHDYNATMPAESAKSFNKYLYLLTSLEREKSQDNLYFTGVTTFDLDWEYIY